MQRAARSGSGTLREAGLGIAAIKAIFARDMTLAEALRLRLRAIGTHIVSLQHVAAALRAALRSEPTEADIRRLCTVTRLTMKNARPSSSASTSACPRACRSTTAGSGQMMAASTPEAARRAVARAARRVDRAGGDRPEREFIAKMRAAAAETWNGGFDVAAHQRVSQEANATARALIDRGVAPTDDAARAVVERMITGLAAAQGKTADAEFRRTWHEQIAGTTTHAPAATGSSSPSSRANRRAAGRSEEWHWLNAAVGHHFAPA